MIKFWYKKNAGIAAEWGKAILWRLRLMQNGRIFDWNNQSKMENFRKYQNAENLGIKIIRELAMFLFLVIK